MTVQEFRTWLQADEPEVLLLECPAGQIAVICQAKAQPGRANEDAVAVLPLGGQRACLVVADGMGGGAQGEVAAQTVVESIAEQFAGPAADADDETQRSALLTGIELANRRILSMGVGAGSTVVAALVSSTGFRTVHAGDSIALVVGQKGRVKAQTTAHSPVGFALEAGLLDLEAAMFHPERHVVSNMVGMEALRMEVSLAQDFNAKDTLVLGSDGLFDNLTTSEIIDLIRTGPLDASAADLAELARRRMDDPHPDEPGKPDDLAFLLFRPGSPA